MLITEEVMKEHNVDIHGRCLVTGRFKIFNGKKGGRKKGSRNKITQQMIDRCAAASEAGFSPEEFLIELYNDPKAPLELRLRAASKIADILYPKSASIEVDMNDNESLSSAELDEKLTALLSIARE